MNTILSAFNQPHRQGLAIFKESRPRVPAFFRHGILACALAAMLAPCLARSADTQTPPPARLEETNSQDTLRAYLELQAQVHATQLAVEQNRKEAEEASATAADRLAGRLQAIEQALAVQRSRELESMQSTNRVMILVAGSFATLGFVAMLLMAYFQWRTVNGLAEISASMPAQHQLGNGQPLAALGQGDGAGLSGGAAAQSNLRLLGAMEQLEKRIYDLEHTSRPGLKDIAQPTAPQVSVETNEVEGAHPRNDVGTAATDRVSLLMEKGQSLLALNKPEEALACFEQALEVEPKNAEALVKRGSALEKLQRLDEALTCYDQAISTNSALTIAYLQKGGLFNRLERFAEALECYEKALHTQEKRAA